MRTRQPKRPPDEHPIEIECDGETYRGSYTIEDGAITVRSPDGSKKAHVSVPVNNETLAKVMLGEIFSSKT